MGNVFSKFHFCNSAQGVMCLRSSASATRIRSNVFRNSVKGELCLRKLCFRDSALGAMTSLSSTCAILRKENVFTKFRSSALIVSLPEVPLPQLRSIGNVFVKFCFRGMTLQSSASAIRL